MDLAMQTTTYGTSDQSWLADPDYAGKVGCTLDLSTFASGQLTGWTTGLKGAIPAGTALGLVTATGKYGPYDNSKSDGTQTLAGILWDDVQFMAGATTGNLGGSRVVLSMVYAAKLPLATATAGTPGQVDAPAQADTVCKIVFA